MKTMDEMNTETKKEAARVPPSLVSKLAEVMAALERLPKLGVNQHFNFRYVTEADVLDSVRAELGRRHVLMLPTLRDTQFEKVGTKTGSMTFCTLKVDFTFMDGDTGETLVVSMMGQGTDAGAGDKAFYKALSGATKYVILKTFLLSSGDDPETTTESQVQAGTTQGQRTPSREERTPSPWDKILLLFKLYGIAEAEGKALVLGTTEKKNAKQLVDADVLKVDVALGKWCLGSAPDEKQLKRAVAILKSRAKAFPEQDRDELQAIHGERVATLTREPGAEG